MTGPCAKQVTTATIVTPDGQRFVGTNYVYNPQATCPRAHLPTGVGYEFCRDICQQSGHAEINALALAGPAARGAKLYLEGHTYACEPCKSACEKAGIAMIIIGIPPMPDTSTRASEGRLIALQKIAQIADQGFVSLEAARVAMCRICVHAYEALDPTPHPKPRR